MPGFGKDVEEWWRVHDAGDDPQAEPWEPFVDPRRNTTRMAHRRPCMSAPRLDANGCAVRELTSGTTTVRHDRGEESFFGEWFKRGGDYE